MKFSNAKKFKYSMETGWKALHCPASLDIVPGSKVTVISDVEWKAETVGTDGQTTAVTHYTASFDEEKKVVTIEGISDQKSSHDFIYLTLREEGPEEVELEISVEINTGMHLIAKAHASWQPDHSDLFSYSVILCFIQRSGNTFAQITSNGRYFMGICHFIYCI